MSEQSLPLDYVEQPNPPPRPTLADERVRRTAAEALMPEIIRWLGRDWREVERQDYIDDLMEVAHIWDGYEAARTLENRSQWMPDQDLVEILGCFWGSAALREATAKWVEANCITPKLAIGQTVKIRKERLGNDTGKITGIDKLQATYTVQTTTFLREFQGQADKGGGNVYPFEDCEPESETTP